MLTSLLLRAGKKRSERIVLPYWRIGIVRYAIPNTVFLFALSFASMPLCGAIIPVFGTGLNGMGQFLSPGLTDPHYTLTLNGLGTGPNPVVAKGANSTEAATERVPQGWPL